jgi:hypothetical protein
MLSQILDVKKNSMKKVKWMIHRKNMSSECESCGEHILDCQCKNDCKKEESKTALHGSVCLAFTAPYGGRIEIKTNKEIDSEQDIGPDEEIEPLHYVVTYNGISCPFYSTTKCGAYAIALGIQWGAYFRINHGE